MWDRYSTAGVPWLRFAPHRSTIGGRSGQFPSAMAYATRLHISLPHALLPTVSCWLSPPAVFRRLSGFSSTCKLFSHSSKFKAPSTLVYAQAKRGFSAKEDDVASCKFKPQISFWLLVVLIFFLLSVLWFFT